MCCVDKRSVVLDDVYSCTEQTTVEQMLQYSLAFVADVIVESARPLHALPDVKI